MSYENFSPAAERMTSCILTSLFLHEKHPVEVLWVFEHPLQRHKPPMFMCISLPLSGFEHPPVKNPAYTTGRVPLYDGYVFNETCFMFINLFKMDFYAKLQYDVFFKMDFYAKLKYDVFFSLRFHFF